MAGRCGPEDGVDPRGPLDELNKALTERGRPPIWTNLAGDGSTGNGRNGHGQNALLADTGKIDLEVPRDMPASFEPQLIAKHRPEHRYPGLGYKVLHTQHSTLRSTSGRERPA